MNGPRPKLVLMFLGMVLAVCPPSQGQQLPSLAIEILADQRIRLAWPSDSEDFILQEAGLLSGAILWQEVNVPRQAQGGFFIVSLEASGNERYFRLVTLVPDATPPQVKRMAPESGSATGGIDRVQVFLSKPVNPATLNAQSVTLRYRGMIEETEPRPVSGLALSYRPEMEAVLIQSPGLLVPGEYHLSVSPPLADLAGNSIIPFTGIFYLFDGIDADGDGLPDDIEILLGYDPTKWDTNGNGIPDGMEDFDNDGLPNTWEILLGTDPRNPDTSGNGIKDGDEDADGDGLSNALEIQLGTNPLRADTDGDGWPDEAEVTAGSDPLDPLSTPALMLTATPQLSLLLPHAPQWDPAEAGVTVARPPVSLMLPVAPQIDPAEAGVTLARPLLNILLPAAPQLDAEDLGVTVGRPAVEVLLPRAPHVEAEEIGTTLARPPVQVRLDAN